MQTLAVREVDKPVGYHRRQSVVEERSPELAW